LDLHMFTVLEGEFFKRIRDQYKWNVDVYYTLTSELMVQLNVCLLGWVIESITLRSVTSVSLSFPEPGRWERTPQKKRKREKHVTGPGSSLWRDHRLWKVEWPTGHGQPTTR
jgi:hypothetical protein